MLNIKFIFNCGLKSRKYASVLLQENGFHAQNCNWEAIKKPQILFWPRLQNTAHYQEARIFLPTKISLAGQWSAPFMITLRYPPELVFDSLNETSPCTVPSPAPLRSSKVRSCLPRRLWSSFCFCTVFLEHWLRGPAPYREKVYRMSVWPRILRLISAKATENTKAFSSDRPA